MIGYTSHLDASNHKVDDVTWGSDQLFIDSMIAYRRKLDLFHRRVEWSMQLNVNNVLNNDAFVRVRVAPDGQLVVYRFNAPREWVLTTRLSF